MAPPTHTKKRKASALTTNGVSSKLDDISTDLSDAFSQSSDDEDASSEEEEIVPDMSSVDSDSDGGEDGEGGGGGEEEGVDASNIQEISRDGEENKTDDKLTEVETTPEIETPGVDPKPLKDREEEEEDEEGPGYRVERDANGVERYVYPDIEPDYDSDDTDAQGPVNTIGNIALSFYDSYPHIGYDINGKKIMRPATREALDSLLDSIEVPKGWTNLTDAETGNPLSLSEEELDLIRKVQTGLIPQDGYDPYPDTVEYFTSIEEKMPLNAAPEPKRRFLPSKHEQKRIMKLVCALRQGRILPYKPPEEREEREDEETAYDIWADEEARSLNVMHVPAPKLPPPGYDLSYNPPPEYLPSKEEKGAWEKADEEDREKDYLPTKYNSLRQVPAWDMFVKSCFERCLDLYLAPRVRKNRLNMDPMSLLTKLPRPEELRPFPTVCQTTYRGHQGRVRSLEISPDGSYLASGGDDGSVRVWELLSGRCLWSVKVSSDEAVDAVRWRPAKDSPILAVAAGEDIYLVIPPGLADAEVEQTSREILGAGFGYSAPPTACAGADVGKKKEAAATWARPGSRLEDEGVLVRITVRSPVKQISWHRRGDHFCTVSPRGQGSSVVVHTLSKHLSQIPFRKLSGLAQAAHFHPSRPLFFVATQRSIRCYDLQKLELVKTLQPGAKWISNFDIHPGGDNVIVGSYDKRLLWHDMDLSIRPYKTMRFHQGAIRAVRYHRGGLPLFADASDDGSLQIFHGKVVSDLMENVTIVPLKMLHGHKVVQRLGVMDLDWHPREPWLVSAGADGMCRLWM